MKDEVLKKHPTPWRVRGSVVRRVECVVDVNGDLVSWVSKDIAQFVVNAVNCYAASLIKEPKHD